MEKNSTCPYCGGKKFVVGKQDGHAVVYPEDAFTFLKSQKLYHEICLNCGTVVRSYVKKPEKLT